MDRLMARFPNLRSVDFGGLWGDSWKVYLSSPLSSPPPSGKTFPAGCIVYDRRVDFYPLSTKPNNAPPPPPLPPTGYSMRYRLELDIQFDRTTTYSRAHLLAAMATVTNAAWRADLSESVRFGLLPLTLGQIGDIFTLHESIGRADEDRLSLVEANAILPFNMADFATFASIAYSSLHHLYLSRRTFREDRCSVSFDDIPVLMEIILEHLPQLHTFVVDTKGVEAAEAICKKLLSESSLERRGSIRNLQIITKPYRGPMFNILRALAPLCSSTQDPRVDVGSRDQSDSDDGYDDGDGQSRFLRYLWR